MTSEHLLSFDRVWRDEKWREIQASISLFKFLIMKVSLSLNGWTAWTLLKLALCSHSDLARSKTLWGLLKDIKIQTRLTCYSLTLIFWFFFICRRTSHTRQCECVLRPEFKYGIFAVQTQEKGRWKAELRYVFEFVSMFIVKLRFTSIVSTSWIEEGQVLISENHWNSRWILSPLS